MPDKFIAREHTASFVESLGWFGQVYAPAEHNGALAWAPVAQPGELIWEFPNTRLSPKHFFSPRPKA